MTNEPEEPAEAIPDCLEAPNDPEAAPEAPKTGLLRFARMAGSSIAGRSAAFRVTDVLNAACYRRPVEEREVGQGNLVAQSTLHQLALEAGR